MLTRSPVLKLSVKAAGWPDWRDAAGSSAAEGRSDATGSRGAPDASNTPGWWDAADSSRRAAEKTSGSGTDRTVGAGPAMAGPGNGSRIVVSDGRESCTAGRVTRVAVTELPHSPQNIAPSGSSLPQTRQFIAPPRFS
jgi:hypothetical protein